NPPLVRLVDRGVDLLRRECREVDAHAGGKHAPRGHDLDRPGPASDLLTDGHPDAVRAIGLPGERVPAVPAGDGQRLPGCHDARASHATLRARPPDLTHDSVPPP